MNFSLWGFWGSLLLYSVVSAILLIFTSGGWTVLLIIPVAGIFYGSVLVLSLITSFVLHAGGTKEITLSRKSLRAVLVLQGLALLLNPNDCGDASGGGPFIFRILLPNDVICQQGVFYSSDFLSVFGFSVLAILALTSLWTLAGTYWKARPIGKTAVSGFLTALIAFYFVVSIILIVGAGWFAWQVVGREYRSETQGLQLFVLDSTGSYADCHSHGPYCEHLLEKYGYSFQLDSGRRYAITGRSFSFFDFLGVILKVRE